MLINPFIDKTVVGVAQPDEIFIVAGNRLLFSMLLNILTMSDRGMLLFACVLNNGGLADDEQTRAQSVF